MYCVYSGKSSATGGIELDAFFPAGENDAAVKETEKTAGGESGLTKPLKLAGVDNAQLTKLATLVLARLAK